MRPVPSLRIGATATAGPRPTPRMLRGGPTGASGTLFAAVPDRVVRLKFPCVAADSPLAWHHPFASL